MQRMRFDGNMVPGFDMNQDLMGLPNQCERWLFEPIRGSFPVSVHI